jgi:hypothetical protein
VFRAGTHQKANDTNFEVAFTPCLWLSRYIIFPRDVVFGTTIPLQAEYISIGKWVRYFGLFVREPCSQLVLG